MAVPVIASSSTNTGASVSSLVITKPTGLASGDLMVAMLALYDISDNNRSWSTPTGWTLATNSSTGVGTELVRTASFYKVADSGDASATNFTFSVSGSVGYVSGYLSRVTGANSTPIPVSESDEDGSLGSTTVSYTTALTPTISDSLVLTSFAGSDSSAGVETVSSYSSSPSATWTERADIGVVSGTDGLVHGVASTDYSGMSMITSRSAVFSQSANDAASSIVVISGFIDASGTNDLLTPTVSFYAPNGSAGEAGTTELFTTSSSVFSSAGTVQTPSGWQNTTRPSLAVERLNSNRMSGDNAVYMNGDNKIYRDSDSRTWTNQSRS